MNQKPKHSFGLLHTDMMLDKLRMEHDDFVKDYTSSRHAVNFAITAHHLLDWVWHERIKVSKNARINGKIKHVEQFKKFREMMLASKAELKYCQDIANGTKHCKIDLYVPEIKETKTDDDLKWDIPTITWEKMDIDWDYSGLVILTHEGELKELAKCFDEVLKYWEDFLSKNN